MQTRRLLAREFTEAEDDPELVGLDAEGKNLGCGYGCCGDDQQACAGRVA